MIKNFFTIRKTDHEFNDLDIKWLDILYSRLNELIESHDIESNRIVFISLYGSQNYNLATVASDVDCECFIFPSLKDLCFIKQPTSFKVSNKDGDMYVKDIRLMFDELRKCSPNILELLASNYILINKNYKEQIDIFLSNVNTYAQLSTYKLLKGLEGLLHRYIDNLHKGTLTSKDITNILRIRQMIIKIINEEKYTDVLIPDNYQELLKIKNNNDITYDTEVLRNEAIDTYQRLIHYYEAHELVFQPHIKQLINDFQCLVLQKYIKNIS